MEKVGCTVAVTLSSRGHASPNEKEMRFHPHMHACMQCSCHVHLTACVIRVCQQIPWVSAFFGGQATFPTHMRKCSCWFPEHSPATFPLLPCQCCLQGTRQLDREEQGVSRRGFACGSPTHCHPPSDSLSPEHRHILLAWSGDQMGTYHSRFPV